MRRTTSETLLTLARALAKQAKILRDLGMDSEARQLIRRGRALDHLGWGYAKPIPVRVHTQRRS